MRSPKERAERYAEVAEDLDSWLGDGVDAILSNWATGQVALDYFGNAADTLDTLFLLAEFARQVPYVLASQVADARYEGHSWNAIAAALRVSRQAVRKRFANVDPFHQEDLGATPPRNP